MFLKGYILSLKCDIFWKEFQRALCKVLNKLLNKIETERTEVKWTFKNVCVHLISPRTVIIWTAKTHLLKLMQDKNIS